MTKQRFLFLIAGVIVAGILSLCAVVTSKDSNGEYRGLFSRHARVFTPPVPDAAVFAGEPSPLDTWYVHEAFERELIANTYMHSSTILMFKRAYRWFPVIEPILKKNGIPDDFKFVAVAESNLSNVVSPAGAEGYWQFIKPTGIRYGLEINENVDERYNLVKATEAACTYFMEAYRKYGNWTLAAASYNRGMDGLSRALENQNVDTYHDLYLNDETARYVFRILALKEIYNNPVTYGFYLRAKDFYPPIPVREVIIDSAVNHLPSFAKKLGVNYRILRELNPWIRNYTLPNKSGKQYRFLLPGEGYTSREKLLKTIPETDLFFHDSLKFNQLH